MTIVMQIVSKSQFKSQVLEYLRDVEKKKQPLVVTHEGKPVVKVIPFKDPGVLQSLRGSLKHYKDPNEPVGIEDWEALK